MDYDSININAEITDIIKFFDITRDNLQKIKKIKFISNDIKIKL